MPAADQPDPRRPCPRQPGPRRAGHRRRCDRGRAWNRPSSRVAPSCAPAGHGGNAGAGAGRCRAGARGPRHRHRAGAAGQPLRTAQTPAAERAPSRGGRMVDRVRGCTRSDNLSERGDPVEAAARLFDALHRADASDYARLAVAPIPTRDRRGDQRPAAAGRDAVGRSCTANSLGAAGTYIALRSA